jgi:hypothetical protein
MGENGLQAPLLSQRGIFRDAHKASARPPRLVVDDPGPRSAPGQPSRAITSARSSRKRWTAHPGARYRSSRSIPVADMANLISAKPWNRHTWRTVITLRVCTKSYMYKRGCGF